MVTEDMITLNSVHRLHDWCKAKLKHKELEPRQNLLTLRIGPR